LGLAGDLFLFLLQRLLSCLSSLLLCLPLPFFFLQCSPLFLKDLPLLGFDLGLSLRFDGSESFLFFVLYPLFFCFDLQLFGFFFSL